MVDPAQNGIGHESGIDPVEGGNLGSRPGGSDPDGGKNRRKVPPASEGASDRRSRGEHGARSKPRSMDVFERIAEVADSARDTVGPLNDPAERDFPELFKFLTRIKVPKVGLIKPATYSVLALANSWQITLRHDALGYSITAESQSILGLLGALETEICSENANWRMMDKGKGARRREAKVKTEIDEKSKSR